VVQSEASLRYAAQSTIDAIGLQPGDAVGAFVPLSSVAALCFGMYLPAMLGGRMVCIESWKPDLALEAMASYEVRWTMLVPTMALQLSVRPSAPGKLAGLTAMTVGGGPMDVGALGRAEEVLGTKLIRVFGMSECLGHTTTRPADDAETRLGRDGRPFPGTEVRAVDDDGRPLPVGELGAAQVRGPSLFVGYARDGEPQLPELTADGFLPTGDLVRLNPDGTINILGRQKQIIIRGGRNIDINEVEAAVARIPQVAQVCVVPVPDELLGERAAALVVSTGPQLTLADVTAHLEAEGFPKGKWPEFVFVVPDLPQNRVGKLSRPEAASLAVELAKQMT
jgi:acyl-CoA synthetase (AMP-forming)/AMP-acid ligase II